MENADDQRSILETEYRFRFKNGGCYALAAALHEQTGLAIGSVIVDWRLERDDPSVTRRSVAHAYVLREDGRAVDIDGESALDDLLKRVLRGEGKIFLKTEVVSFESLDKFEEYLAETYGEGFLERAFDEIDDARTAVEMFNLVEIARSQPNIAP